MFSTADWRAEHHLTPFILFSLYMKPPSALSAKIFISFFCRLNTILTPASLLSFLRKEVVANMFLQFFTVYEALLSLLTHVMIAGNLSWVSEWTVRPLNTQINTETPVTQADHTRD